MVLLLLKFCFNAPGTACQLDSHRARILSGLTSFGLDPDALDALCEVFQACQLLLLSVSFRPKAKLAYAAIAISIFDGASHSIVKNHFHRETVQSLARTPHVDAKLALREGLSRQTF